MSLENKLLKTTLLLLLFVSTNLKTYSQDPQCSDCCVLPFFGIPGESNCNRLEEDGKIFQYPFTMFNKTGKPGYWKLSDAVKEIQNRILRDKPASMALKGGKYFEIYAAIYNNAISTRPEAGGGEVEAISELAKWTKNNAFVNLIKLDNWGYSNELDLLGKPNHSFADRAKEGLYYMNYDVNVCLGYSDCNLLQFRGKELIMYLQAYDLLKATEDIKDDVDEKDCSYRNRLRMFARYFYYSAKGPTGVIDSWTGWKKNHGLMACGALGVAAVVLNDAGVKPKMVNWRWSPHTWAREAIDGIEDNLFVGSHIGLIGYDVPMASKDFMTGYAEGPSYFNYAFENLIPFFRAMSNFVPNNSDRNYFSRTKNPDIMRVLDWADSIQTTGTWIPGFDNSGVAVTSILGITGLDEFHSNSDIASSMDLRADFLAALSEPKSKSSETNPITILEDAGSALIRSQDNSGSQHTFHLLFESGKSIAPLDNISSDWSHEDNDFGSFSLYTGNIPLVIDPPYLSSAFSDYTNKIIDHNYAFFNNGELSFNPNDITSSDKNSNLKLEYEQVDRPAIFLPPYWVDEKIGDIERDVTRFKVGKTIYYILNDKFSSENENESVISLNGNGNIDDTTFYRCNQSNSNTFDANGRVFKWTSPFKKDASSWSLLAHNSVLNTGATLTINEKTQSTVTMSWGTEHGEPNSITRSLGTKSLGGKTSWAYGIHTRIEVIHETENSLIQTFLMPYRKTDTLPLIFRKETSTFVTTTLQFIGTTIDYTKYYKKGSPPPGVNPIDTFCDFHLARRESGTSEIEDPFNMGSNSDTIKTDGKKAFARFSTASMKTEGFCAPSFIKINSASITNGSYLSFEDTMYIEASSSQNLIQYNYVSKFRYQGYCNGSGNVKFYLPDMEYGYPMKATGNVGSYSHNHTGNYKFISIYFSGPGPFLIELKNPCMDDCYFPPTNMTIDSTFNFDIGSLKSLSHDLDIIPGDGLLNIRNASRMSICPDNVLVNKDSIVMYMSCVPEKRWTVSGEDTTRVFLPLDSLKYICDRGLLLADRGLNETRNMIIVNERAGLVLDSGSVTHIGNNSTILIRSGGTLLIKSGATLIVGDSDCILNQGELLADHGSYVCVEEGAILKFYNDIDSFNFFYKDTLDRHIIYIAMNNGSGGSGAISGINPSGGRGKFASDGGGTWSTNNCLAFCDWRIYNAPYGVDNRPFGWCNISQPKAYFTSLDTLCINKPFGIDARKSLNEIAYKITVCKYDTTSKTCITSIDSTYNNGDVCLGYLYLFTPTETGYYRVRLIVFNDCSQTDTFTKIIYVPNVPVAHFSGLDSICPGIGTLHLDGSLSTSNIIRCKHQWAVETVIDDTTNFDYINNKLPGTKIWLIDTLAMVDSNFSFPGYNFVGGIRYIVSLKVWGWCGDSTVWDTVSVPLKVKINMEVAPRNYSNPVGPIPIRLKGVVLNATSWSWSPTSYLDYPDSLNPIATPPDSIVYVLTGVLGGCSASDSILIRHNARAFAGEDRTVCFNEKTVLGTDYNAAAMVGLMQYKGGSDFWDRFTLIRVDENGRDINVQKYLTQYAIERVQNSSSPYIVEQLWSNHPEIREAIIKHPNFPQYFENFVNSNGSSGALAYFDSYIINTDSELKDAIDNLMSFSGYYFDIEDYFTAFETWYMSRSSGSGFIDVIWEKKVDTTWCVIADWDSNYNALVDTNKTTTYRMTLIDNVNSIVEYDEVNVLIDTAITPRFEVAYQIDSTVYFTNLSSSSGFDTQEWDFGDGSTHSTEFHTYHTFPAYDSIYVVCLSVTNKCSTYVYCDTVRVDSFGLLYNGFTKTGNKDYFPKIDTSLLVASNRNADIQQQTPLEVVENQVQLDNVPNPFSEATNISYTIGKEFKNAEIRIIDVLGRTVKVYPLRSMKGQIEFYGNPYMRGLYYSVLVIDGVVAKSKTMLIER